MINISIVGNYKTLHFSLYDILSGKIYSITLSSLQRIQSPYNTKRFLANGFQVCYPRFRVHDKVNDTKCKHLNKCLFLLSRVYIQVIWRRDWTLVNCIFVFAWRELRDSVLARNVSKKIIIRRKSFQKLTAPFQSSWFLFWPKINKRKRVHCNTYLSL